MAILDDRNYRKYAIRKANSIKAISIIDKWARDITIENLRT